MGNIRGIKGRLVTTRICLSLMLSLLFFSGAHGAEYPTKAVEVVSNFPPGGITDVTARILHKKLSILLGQPVVVVNKAGGGGTVGAQTVSVAPPDGYTVLVSAPTIVISPMTVDNGGKGISKSDQRNLGSILCAGKDPYPDRQETRRGPP